MNESRPKIRIRERLLGAFVCFQLLAIPIGSYIKLVPVRVPEHHGEINGDLQLSLPPEKWISAREPMQTIFDSVAWVSSRWGELTGQAQCWALFASFGKKAAFPVVELHWTEESGIPSVKLKTHFEPDDPCRYFYPPEPSCRLYNYEYRTCIFYWVASPAQFDDQEDYRKHAIDCVRDMHRSVGTFLRWRTEKYLKEHPGTPHPNRIVLIARVLPNPAPGTSRLSRPPAYEIPVAQWLPHRVNESQQLAIDAWDPVNHSFVRLEKRSSP
jgi:hypothetical protein